MESKSVITVWDTKISMIINYRKVLWGEKTLPWREKKHDKNTFWIFEDTTLIIHVMLFCWFNLFGLAFWEIWKLLPTMAYCITLNSCNCVSWNYGNLTCIQDRQGVVNGWHFLRSFKGWNEDLHSRAGFVTAFWCKGTPSSLLSHNDL